MTKEATPPLPDGLVERYKTALSQIAFLRPAGPCRNKLVERMERIALDALGEGL